MAREWQNMFAITSFRCIEVLLLLLEPGLRYIEYKGRKAEEGWFGQPKYSTRSKKHSTLCRFLPLYSTFYL